MPPLQEATEETELLGQCETCGAEIHEGERHYYTGDACWLCQKCSPNLSDVIANWRSALVDNYPLEPEDYNCDSIKEFKFELAEMEADLKSNGDRNLAYA